MSDLIGDVPDTGGSLPVREIGHVLDANGARITVGADCDAVTLTGAGVILDAGKRNEFIRLFCQAEWAAEAWAKEHAGAGDG